MARYLVSVTRVTTEEVELVVDVEHEDDAHDRALEQLDHATVKPGTTTVAYRQMKIEPEAT